jgi:hypothetical protein
LINGCILPEYCWDFLEFKEASLYSCFGFELKDVRRHERKSATVGYYVMKHYETAATIVKFRPHRYYELHNNPEWGTYQRTNTTFYECGHKDKEHNVLKCKIEGSGIIINECKEARCIQKGRTELEVLRYHEPHFPRACVMTVDPKSPTSKGPLSKNKKYQYRTTTFHVCQHGWVRLGNHQAQARFMTEECHEDECRAKAQVWSNTEEGKYCLD